MPCRQHPASPWMENKAVSVGNDSHPEPKAIKLRPFERSIVTSVQTSRLHLCADRGDFGFEHLEGFDLHSTGCRKRNLNDITRGRRLLLAVDVDGDLVGCWRTDQSNAEMTARNHFRFVRSQRERAFGMEQSIQLVLNGLELVVEVADLLCLAPLFRLE